MVFVEKRVFCFRDASCAVRTDGVSSVMSFALFLSTWSTFAFFVDDNCILSLRVDEILASLGRVA